MDKSTFSLILTGQIVQGEFKGGSNLTTNFEFVWGKHWDTVKVTGEGVNFTNGQTQVAGRTPGINPKYTWNFPLNVTFHSTNAYGWPKVILTTSKAGGKGDDKVEGYGWTHIPTSAGRHKLRVYMYRPRASSTIQQIMAWLTKSPVELIDPKTVTQNEGRAVIRMETIGHIDVEFDVILKDFEKAFR